MAEAPNAPLAPIAHVPSEDEKFLKETGAKVLVSLATHPLLTVKTLIQLGYEPFPLSRGKTLIVAGREAFFLPNAFSYGAQLAQTHADSWRVLYRGFDAAALGTIVGRYTSRAVAKYIDDHYPDMGGKPEFEGKDERELTDEQSFRRMLRAAIRDSTARTVVVIVTRPLTVVCIRQIAEIIGGESKYTNVLQGLRIIGNEEGPGGLFSGLVPQICAELILVWGVHTLTYFAERALTRSGLDQGDDKEKAEKDFKEARRLIHIFGPHLVAPFSYPYAIVSTVVACVGSGLAVSFLPYSPTFSSWHDCFDYLSPTGLKRGSRLFLREHPGAVSTVGHTMFANNKHFA